MAKQEKYLGLGNWTVSDDGKRIAYSIDTTGFRRFTTFVRELGTAVATPQKIADATTSVEWSAGDKPVLFYTVENESAKRSYWLYRHLFNSTDKTDELVYEEKEEDIYLGQVRSQPKQALLAARAREPDAIGSVATRRRKAAR